MHDLLLAREILEIIKDYAKQHGLRSVSRVEIELGRITGEHHTPEDQDNHCHEEISPENLKYNFNLIKKNSIAALATLKIKETSKPGWRLQEIYGE